MRKIYIDFETFYSKEYSLRKLTPMQYILGPQYETIGCGIAIDDAEPKWLEGDKVATLLSKVTGSWMAISHNALFDMRVLAYRYGIRPPISVDTMAIARAILTPFLPRGSVSLQNVSDYLGIPKENKLALGNVLGWHLDAIKEHEESHYKPLRAMCLDDVRRCRLIYQQLSPKFSAQEHKINDMVIRMATIPQFAMDVDKLLDHKVKLSAYKAALLAQTGVDKPSLMSNDKFAELLRNLGVEPGLKPSPADPTKFTYAFAKTDVFMESLEEHDDPDVQALAAARLGHKSTLEETRTQRFIDIASVTFDGTSSWFPVPLRFSGAHTHRFSGDDKLNAQNLPSRKSTLLRESLVAPPDHIVMSVDASQIEARLTAWLAGCTSMVNAFANAEDIYSIFATTIFGYPVIKKLKKERMLGKISILGLGFGMGPPKFKDTVRIQSAGEHQIILDPDEAKRVVLLYRRTYPEIPAAWRFLDRMIERMHAGTAEGTKWGPVTFENNAVVLPSGLRLFYRDLRYNDGKWSYWDGQKRKSLWGGTFMENIVQALDRQAVMEAAVRIDRRIKAAGITLEPSSYLQWS